MTLKYKKHKNLSKRSKLYAIGPQGRKEIIAMRAEGSSYYAITDYLNANYRDRIENRSFTMQNVYHYFRVHGKEQVSRVKQEQIESINKAIGNAKKLEDLLSVLYTWLNEYKDAGMKLKLKDTINAIIKIHELIAKMQSEKKGEEQATTVKTFLTKVQQEFSSPSDKELVMREVKLTQKTKEKKEDEKKEDEEELAEPIQIPIGVE